MLKVAKSMAQLPLEQLEGIYGNGLDVDYLRYEFFSVPGAVYCLWLVDGACVSAVRLEPWLDGWLLSGLETAPDQRNRGYARELIKAVQSRFAGGKLYSHIHHRNRASVRVHEACGFQKISDCATYLDDSVVSHSGTYLHE